MKEILTLIILVNGIYQVRNDSVSIQMVNFTGRAESGYFKGEILPGGVDTQTILPDGKTFLSARYMLEGIDYAGDSCRIYIDNKVTESTPQGYTQPTIVTDSKLISELATGKLVGKMDSENGDFLIRIYAAGE